MTVPIRPRRLVSTLTLAVVLAALGAGPALGDPPNQPRFFAPKTSTAVREPEIIRGLVSTSAASNPSPRPEIIAGLAPATAHYDVSGRPVQAPPSGSSGFAWGDAGIGAAAAFGALFVAAACALVVRRHVTPAH